MDMTVDWTIARSKQHFSELVRACQREPQLIYNRSRLVAALVEPELL